MLENLVRFILFVFVIYATPRYDFYLADLPRLSRIRIVLKAIIAHAKRIPRH